MLCPAAAMPSTSVTPASSIQAAVYLRTVSAATMEHGVQGITFSSMANTVLSAALAGLVEIA